MTAYDVTHTGRGSLSELMDFDHVIHVHGDGTVTEPRDVYAPDCNDGAVEGDWSLLTGFSGQYRYSGPIMHPSELIAGGIARYILENPGTYVAVVAYYMCERDDHAAHDSGDCDECEGFGDTAEGWAIAYQVEA